jgi:exosortase
VSLRAVPTGQLKTRFLELLVFVAVSAAIWWRPLVATAKLAIGSETYTHILLVVPLSITLIYFESRESTLNVDRSWAGITLLIAALLLRGLAAWNAFNLSANDTLSLSMLGLVIWWLGSVIISFGLTTFRSQLFPLSFLIFLVPFPDCMLTAITDFMQHASAWAAAILFRLAHVPAAREGVFIAIPGLTIEVAQECSSLRSSMMLLLITLILAYLFLDSWWGKALLLVTVIPLSIAKNALRIFTIPELGTRVDPSYLHGKLHHHGGVLFLGLAIVVMISMLRFLRKAESLARQRRWLLAD